jgi:CRISPR-associated endonuclease Csn1
LGEEYTGTFNLEDSRRSGLKGNETSYDFRKLDLFGPGWDNISIKQQDEIIETLITEESEETIKNYLKPLGLTDEQIRKLSGHPFQPGTVMLSSRFMIECSEIMMKEHLRYDEAIKKMGFHHSDKGSKAIQRSLPYYGKIIASSVTGGSEDAGEKNLEKRYGRIPNPTVHIALNQLRKLVNALIHRFGNPSEIILEINRELKQSKARKDEITREQTKNQKENERIRKELTDLGLLQIGSEDIKKYKLWEELSGEGLIRRCPYCGKNISAKQLMSGAVEIEHILPYSRTLLNSRDNLTVAHQVCNQAKGNRSPYEAFGSNPVGFDWTLITE